MASVNPYEHGEAYADSATAWRVALAFRRAYMARQMTIRLKGAGLDYAVIADGQAGPETLASGSTGVTPTTRITLPEIVAAKTLELRVKLTAPGNGVTVFAEASWDPIGEGPERENR